MPSLRAEPDPDRPLGHARIVVEGLAGPPADAGFCIRREGYPAPNLGKRGWQVREERLAPLQVLREGGDTVLVVGPGVTRHLEPAPYMFLMPGAGLEQALFWPDTIDIYDGELPEQDNPAEEEERERERESQRQAEQERERQRRREEEEAREARRRQEEEERQRRQRTDPGPVGTGTGPPIGGDPPTGPGPKPPGPPIRLPLLVGLALLLLAVIGGGAYYFTSERNEQVEEVPPTDPVRGNGGQAEAPPPPPPWPEGTDGLSLRELVERAPDAAGIHAAALRRQAAGRHDDALVLLEEAGDRGHAPSLTALARLYDPIGFVPDRPFRNPDPRAAARYYREAAERGDEAAAAPRAALRQWLEEQARAGNGTAETALREFWQ